MTDLPALPVRLNNPGDLRDPSTGSFRQFKTKGEGMAALMNDLQGKMTGTTSTGLGPASTLYEFAKTYAPPGDNNNSAKYATDLANQLQVRPDTKLSELQSKIGQFAAAVATNEGYVTSLSGGAKKSVQTPDQTLPMDTGVSASAPDTSHNVLPFVGISKDFNTRVEAGADAFQKGTEKKQSEGSTALQMIGEGAGFVGDIATETLKGAGNALSGTDNSGKTTTLTDVIGGALKAMGKTAPAQAIAKKVEDFTTKHPEASGDLGALFNIASIIPEGAGAESIAEGVAKKGADAVEAAKVAGSKGNAIPTLAASAERLKNQSVLPKSEKALSDMVMPIKQGVGRTTIQDPAKLHEQYFDQEKNALSDTKQDTALGLVGTDIGNAFEKVLNIRKQAGKVMQDEIKTVGNIKTDVSKALDGFKSEIANVGLKYNPKSKSLTRISRGAEIPMTNSDRTLVRKYLSGLDKLGTTPTIKNLDAFLKRIPDEMKVYKAKNNILGTTNGERIIKNHLTSLRKNFSPEVSGVKLTKYNNARKEYAQLSKVVEDGVPFLGKKTSTGDFAKDASLAKSSVQSVLNNGKKDWLMKLEQITGEPLLDKATLALQAMSDAGDYRGESLLKLLSEEGAKAVKSSSGLLEQVVKGGLGLIKGAALGSKFDQTQRYLKSLK